jgi:3-methyladenine DNA glycosylase AlkD
MKDLITSIDQAIKTASGISNPLPEERFHKHREYLSYGLKAQDFYLIMKDFRLRFQELSLNQRLQLAGNLVSRHIGELGLTGIYVIALSVDELGPEHFDKLDRMVDDFRSWSQVDYLCGDVLQPLLYKYESEVLSMLKKWNTSSNRWKRRASIVPFTRKVAKEGKFVDITLNLCDNLIWDREDIVHKGVGWALKDTMRSAPQQIKDYVKNLRKLGVSSTITLYAIRDLKGEERKEILQVKKSSG